MLINLDLRFLPVNGGQEDHAEDVDADELEDECGPPVSGDDLGDGVIEVSITTVADGHGAEQSTDELREDVGQEVQGVQLKKK